MEFTPQELGEKMDRSTREQYNRLRKKYLEQQKIITALKNDERFEIREKFKHLSAGRKRKYTPLTIKNRIIDYFATIMAKNKPPTVSGLMVHLKMHRDQFYAYKNYPEFKDIMEQTSNMIENWYEENMALGKCNGTNAQFILKNRFGWQDQTTIKYENDNDEQYLIRKIEALAPQLVGFFQTTTTTTPEAVEQPKQLAEVIDVDFSEVN